LTAIYGWQPEQRLGFLILVQFPTPGATTSASSRWIGSATHASGATVAYEASLSDIEINSESFVFDEGRVFFGKAEPDSTEIHQLDLEVGTTTYDEEIDRIAASPEVEARIEIPQGSRPQAGLWSGCPGTASCPPRTRVGDRAAPRPSKEDRARRG
jgi:hypothetical protein